MDLPVPNPEVLDELYTRKRGCSAEIHAAEAGGDLKEARKLRIRMREIVSLIKERGGDQNA